MTFKFTFLALALCAVFWLASVSTVSARRPRYDWEGYKRKHNKTYSDQGEDAYRKDIFLARADEIDRHNADGTKTYKKGINQFSDITQEEFQAQFTGTRAPKPAGHNKVKRAAYMVQTRLSSPAAIDWRQRNVVTPVKNQGTCGNCWAFSTTGALESAYAIKHGNLISLSEEFLTDCDKTENPGGCQGGWPATAMNFIKNKGGIPTESAYPYTSTDSTQSSACKSGVALSGVTVTGSQNNGGNETSLRQMVGTIGPVSVAVDAAHGCDWQSYKSGIFNEPGCFKQSTMRSWSLATTRVRGTGSSRTLGVHGGASRATFGSRTGPTCVAWRWLASFRLRTRTTTFETLGKLSLTRLTLNWK